MTVRRRVHQGSKLPPVASERCDGQKEEWEMADVHGFH
jgi:hypothetical protein